MAKKMIDDIIAAEEKGNDIIKSAQICADEITATAKAKAYKYIESAKIMAQANADEEIAKAESISAEKSNEAHQKAKQLRTELEGKAKASENEAIECVLEILKKA